ERSSPRLHLSFGAAASRLGATSIALTTDGMPLERAETIADTARSLSDYADAIVVAAFAQETVEAFARSGVVPVLNAASETHRPCQALADLLTIKEAFGDLAGRRVAFIGDGRGSLARSLIEACALAELNLTIACPQGYGPEPELLRQ